ncbi:hypothetical protein ARAM_003408 [Aspergillus rambellii]|uniref:Alpha-ketoglutarate-dependent dioxygenase AlkB-like domain-containing protein n=1 Tax=Aspergillus rambellii TaxID=308745 RepID=A0A0F8WGT5_9EURO|nr:hypothetical protein ARAM_003408 [Aspergillus rambellii]
MLHCVPFHRRPSLTTIASPLALSPAIQAAISDLPDVDGEPPAWADCRPELSDAIPWFRAVQGGVYHNGNICWGFLLDADSGIRSYIDDEVVITRVGGGCVKDAEGNLVLTKDQDSDSTALRSILNSMALNIPVGMIIGDRNTLLQRKLPHRYNILSFFRISHVWYEKIGKKTGARVRFEKLDLASKSWWALKGSSPAAPPDQRNFDMKPETKQCAGCLQTSARVYDEGWMCLHPSCKLFWTINASAPPETLTFHPGFLESRLRPDPEIQPHFSLVPSLLSTLNDGDQDISSARIAWKGIVCPRCCRCISRRFWNGWKCTDYDIQCSSGHVQNRCPFEKLTTMHPVSLRSVIDDFELSPIKRALFFDPKFAMPEIDDRTFFPYRKLSYRIPGAGYITHFVSSQSINTRPNGPNDLFNQLQVADAGLRRYPLQQSVVAGTLTAHFAVNYGMPYKYIVSVDSRGFSNASDAILRSLGRLTWATEQAVQGQSTEQDPLLLPNELLLLGYFEDMKIGYHDDGESSLGPTIATLSLGAKSTMLVRMKYKYYHGRSKAKKLLDSDPVLQGCEFFAQRAELKHRWERGDIAKPEYDRGRETIVAKTRTGDPPPCVKMELHHGDLVVMHGAGLQRFYEHSVIPEKKLRFALTARYIKPEDVDPAELRKGKFTLAPDQVYDGK